MFIYNFKINKNKSFKTILFFIIFLTFIILFFSILNLYSNNIFKTTDEPLSKDIVNIESEKYTDILKEVYDNIEDYIGQQINVTGYIYRLDDFPNNQFVIARNMIINSDSQSVVVGFLCLNENANSFLDGTWINITGTIIKGYYHGDIPVIKINKIEETATPENEFVYPPNNTYIPTSTIL